VEVNTSSNHKSLNLRKIKTKKLSNSLEKNTKTKQLIDSLEKRKKKMSVKDIQKRIEVLEKEILEMKVSERDRLQKELQRLKVLEFEEDILEQTEKQLLQG
jgi:hypothetical protein